MPGHPTQPLVDPFTGRTVPIDVDMVPIIKALWSLGIETLECCQGNPGGFFTGSPAVICFPFVGRVDHWGLPRSRFRRGKQAATDLVLLLHDADPVGWWRTWDWIWDDLNPGSALLLPNEELPLLTWALERIERRAAFRRDRAERAAAGQLVLDTEVAA